MQEKRPVLFSGIQPSGNLNIGNYIGAIRNWNKLQFDYDCLFSLVDLHTITVRQDPEELRKRCYDFLSLYIACGIDPKNNILFVQSHVPQHAELAWILNCYTYMGELSRMTQFKDKSQKAGKNINVGLFDYPVLMAADILLYDTKVVPVGADQKQHIELARDVALRFNKNYGDVFTIPEPFIPKAKEGARIMGLQEPEQKMSKSDPNASNVIALLDDPKVLTKKIKRAVTDSGGEVCLADDKPGISNLLTIFSAVTDTSIEQLEADYRDVGYGKFKGDLAEAVVAFLEPIQQKFHAFRDDTTELDKILRHGAERARERADKMLRKVRDVVGFIKG